MQNGGRRHEWGGGGQRLEDESKRITGRCTCTAANSSTDINYGNLDAYLSRVEIFCRCQHFKYVAIFFSLESVGCVRLQSRNEREWISLRHRSQTRLHGVAKGERAGYCLSGASQTLMGKWTNESSSCSSSSSCSTPSSRRLASVIGVSGDWACIARVDNVWCTAQHSLLQLQLQHDDARRPSAALLSSRLCYGRSRWGSRTSSAGRRQADDKFPLNSGGNESQIYDL